MEDITLYHGSREGIEGDISPCSRPRCDFGKGFYMGTNKQQARALVSNESRPTLYTVRFKLSEIPEERILRLTGEDWLKAILAERQLSEKYSKLDVAKIWRRKLEKYDVVIGKIADDAMMAAVKEFANNQMTDVALAKCLQSVDLGEQYVAKTEFACSKIEIVKARELKGQELQIAQKESSFYRKNAIEVITKANRETKGQGSTLEEIIKREKHKENGKKGR